MSDVAWHLFWDTMNNGTPVLSRTIPGHSISFKGNLFVTTRLKLSECSLHSIKSKETREVKMFSTKTSRDVGMVPSVSKEHVCPHGKINWWKNFRNKEGYHSMLNNPG